MIDNQLVIKALVISLSKLMQIIYASVGSWMLLVWVGYKEKHRQEPLSLRLIEVGGLCMGVYLTQQFILKYLYYHTSMSYILGPYCTPWIGFVFTIILSLIVASLLSKTALGRKLIG